jgi:hypothetical protein
MRYVHESFKTEGWGAEGSEETGDGRGRQIYDEGGKAGSAGHGERGGRY